MVLVSNEAAAAGAFRRKTGMQIQLKKRTESEAPYLVTSLSVPNYSVLLCPC
jgi:hypothetical protein